MKLSKILSKRVLSLLIVGLFVFTAFAVIQSGGGQAQASPSAVNSFTFPYQYGTPTIPSNVGAQGIQGPTVPLSDIGVQGHVGVTGRIGGHQNIPSPIQTAAKVLVKNGTLSSSTVAVGIPVTMTNMQTGINYTGVTNTQGWFNISLPNGFYVLASHLSTTAANVNFLQEVTVGTSGLTTTEYLIPVSYTTVNVNNGGTSKQSLNLTVGSEWYISNLPERQVEILNASSGSTVIATAYTNDTGIAHFTGMNSAYSYYVETIGYDSSLTGVYYYEDNQSNAFTQSTYATFFQALTIPTFMVGGTLTGTSIPTNFNAWTLSTNTTVVNATLYMGTLSQSTGGLSLTLKNDIVYWNSSQNYFKGNLVLNNTTVIFLTESMGFFTAHLFIQNSTIEGSPIPGAMFNTLGMFFDSIWTNNSIFTGDFYNDYSLSCGHNSLTGNYSNDEFSNLTISSIGGSYNSTAFKANFYNSTFVNSLIFDNSDYGSGPTPTELTFSRVSFSSTYFVLWSDSYSIDNSSVQIPETSISMEAHGGFSSVGFGSVPAAGYDSSFYHDNLTITASVQGWNDTFKNPYYANNPRNEVLVPFNLTMEYSDFKAVYPVANITVLGPDGGKLNVSWNIINSILDFNASESFYTSQPYDRLGSVSFVIPNGPNLLSHDYMETGTNFFFNVGTGTTFSNDIFPYEAYISPLSLFGVNFAYTSTLTFANDTFGIVNYNLSSMGGFMKYIYEILGFEWFFNSNPPSPHMKYDNFIHDTFDAAPVGVSSTGQDDALLQLDENNFTANVTYSLFKNDRSAYNLPANLQNYAYPFGSDIELDAEHNVIANNYFLNLNNITMPISVGQINMEGGWGTGFVKEYATIYDNHYYYSPAFGGNLDPNAPYLTNMNTTNSPVSSYCSKPMDTISTYEISMVHNSSLNVTLGGQLVENTSVIQHDYYSSWQYATGSLFTKAYSYAILPDVTIQGDTPVISYSNGLVGGPQPHFEWKGYNYSESVEPTYIQVGVNSSKAPSIGLQFQGIAGALYDIEMFNNGSLISSYQESATSLGVLNATYNPATMPLDPVFYVEYIGSGVTPPPVVPPLVPIVPHVLFGIPYLNVIVLFGGIALASEEFFRTQTKGNEKRYSYTGVFVGIMIAGIGLMSVL